MEMCTENDLRTCIVIKKTTKILYLGISIIVLCSLLRFPLVQSFNIDEEYPVVITDTFDGEKSHFGLSVMILERTAGHGTPEEHDPPTGWILIGAPHANSTYPNHTKINEPGVLWRCGIGRKEMKKDDCRPVVVDPTHQYDPKDGHQEVSHKDMKDGGRLGATMFTGDSDRFVSCASRWVNQKYSGNHFLQGICYWLPRSHVSTDAYNSSWPWLPPKYSNRLIPLLTRDRLASYVRNENGTDEKYFNWAYGQAGFSVNIPNNNEMILGAPGIFEWTGSVIQYRDVKEPHSLFQRYNSHPSSPAFSEFLVAKLQDDTGKIDELEHFDYFGYAVTSGNFFHKNISSNRTQYAGGAPRASSMSGKVLIFSFREVRDTNVSHLGRLDYLVDALDGRNTNYTHYGSYFGSVLLSVDLTKDGFDDLLVGAPLYGATDSSGPKSTRMVFESPDNDTSNKATSDFLKQATMISGDEGCAFVYFSTGYDFKRIPQVLCGDKISGSRFGSAITKAGDLNLDGFNDIAIGAPYENEGRGAVYVYHGGRKLYLAQKLQPEAVDIGLRGFGYSLSSGIDIDNNHYPDLAVGAFGSSQVVIYRTIPLVTIAGNLSVSIPKLLTNTELFNVTSCIGFKGISLPEILGIWVKITISRESNQEKVLSWFTEETFGASNISRFQVVTTKQVLLHYKQEGMCVNFTAKRIGNVDELRKNVTIKQEYWLKGYGSSPKPPKPIYYDISKDEMGNPMFAISNNSQSDFSEFSHKKEPLPISNMWKTDIFELPIGTGCEADRNPSCVVNLTINAKFKSLVHDYEWREDTNFIIGTFSMLILEVDIFNHREKANLPITVDINWKSPPNIRKMGHDCSRINEDPRWDQQYRCSINKPIREGKKESIRLDFEMTSLYGGGTDEYLELEVKVNTSSIMMSDARKQFKFPIVPDVEFSLLENSNDGLLPYEAQNRFVNLTHTYEINLKGPSPVYKIQMEYFIPTVVETSGSLTELLFVREPIIIYDVYDGIIECHNVNGSFIMDNPQNSNEMKETLADNTFKNNGSAENYVDSNESFNHAFSGGKEYQDNLHTRSRRSLLDIDSDSDEKIETETIACGLPNVKCMKVVCTATKVKNTTKAVIEFKLRMVADVAKSFIPYGIDFLVITSNAVMKMLDRNDEVFGDIAQVQFYTTLAIQGAPEIPAWILIVAVTSGLIIFTLVTIVLVKCGFFQRKKRDELAALKVRKEIDDNFGQELKKRYEDVSSSNRYSRMNVTDAYTLRMSDGDYNW